MPSRWEGIFLCSGHFKQEAGKAGNEKYTASPHVRPVDLGVKILL